MSNKIMKMVNKGFHCEHIGDFEQLEEECLELEEKLLKQGEKRFLFKIEKFLDKTDMEIDGELIHCLYSLHYDNWDGES